MASEAYIRESKFKSIWEKEGPQLMGRLFLDFKKGFSRKELTATLSVCTDTWSFSNPLVIRVVNFLKSGSGTEAVWPDYAFASIVFHELLHIWLAENFNHISPLLTKYSNEPDVVRNHLHLMALQKAVYLELKRTDMLNWIGENYPMHKGGEARAWEIVNKIEGYQAFISEIKK